MVFPCAHIRVAPTVLLNAFLATLNARGSFRETVRDKTAGAFVSIPLSKPLGSHATTNDRPEYSQGHENQVRLFFDEVRVSCT